MTDMFNRAVLKADQTESEGRIDEVVPCESPGTTQVNDHSSHIEKQVDGLIYSDRLSLTLKIWAKLTL